MDVSADKLASAIAQTLEEFSGAVAEDVRRITKEQGKKTAERVRQNVSSAGIGGSGEYRKNWTSRYKETMTGAEATVYNRPPTYRLAHLLEYGHAKVNGGRARAFPHIEKAEKDAIEAFEKELKEAIQK